MTSSPLLPVFLALLWPGAVRADEGTANAGAAPATPGASYPGTPTGANRTVER
jgi:hypothetical protein